MSSVFAVWRPTEQLTAETASRFCNELCSRPFRSFIPSSEMQDFVNIVLERYNAVRGTSDVPWAIDPDIGEDCALMSIQSARLTDLFPIIRRLARERRLVFFDSQHSIVYQPALENIEASDLLTLEISDGRVIDGPTEAMVEGSVRGLSGANWFVILERRENQYIQAGYGEEAGAPKGTYVLEYREGSPEKHWRTLSPSLDDIVSAFLDYSRGRMDWTRAFTWTPFDAEDNPEGC